MTPDAIVHKYAYIEEGVKRIEDVYSTFSQFESDLTNEIQQ